MPAQRILLLTRTAEVVGAIQASFCGVTTFFAFLSMLNTIFCYMPHIERRDQPEEWRYIGALALTSAIFAAATFASYLHCRACRAVGDHAQQQLLGADAAFAADSLEVRPAAGQKSQSLTARCLDSRLLTSIRAHARARQEVGLSILAAACAALIESRTLC